MNNPSPLAKRIDKARMSLILDAPFFGALIMHLPCVAQPGVRTFVTDGQHIFYEPAYAAKLDDMELRYILAHEVAHCALGHLWRTGAREIDRWNTATDHAVAEMLDSYVQEQRRNNSPSPWKPIQGMAQAGQYPDKSSEEIYQLIPEPPPGGGGGGSGSGSGSNSPSMGSSPGDGDSDGDDDGDGQGQGQKPSQGKGRGNQPTPGQTPGQFQAPEDQQQQEEQKDKWQIATMQAATAAKMQGKCPACIERLIEEIRHPKVPWQDVLREFLRAPARDDYSFRRPNRRMSGGPILLPGLRSERVGKIVIAVDTSGSVDGPLLAEFQAEVQAVLDETKPEVVEVIYCDAMVQRTEEFRVGDAVRLNPKGGGGTAFAPVFELVDQAEEEPACLVYLTDGYGSHAEQEPAYPVLWVTYGTDRFPWGRVVKAEI